VSDTAVIVLLWGLVVLELGWTWIPALISGLGGTRYANGGSEDYTQLETATEPDYLFWHRQLISRGYTPLGTGWMRLTYYGSDWRYETHVRAFRSAERGTFAFVQQQPRPLDVWWLTMFATCWQDGSLLLTSNANDQPPGDGEYIVQGIESTDLAAVEVLHASEVVRLRSAGRRADPDGSLETLLRVTAKHAGPAARYTGVKLGQSYLLAHGGIHGVLSIPVAAALGFGHWALPAVNLVLGATLTLSQYSAKRRAGRLMREQLRAIHGAPDSAPPAA
jgi:hypothetical protein